MTLYRLFIVASSVFQEGIRKRFLFVLLTLCFLLLAVSLILGQISLDEQTRLSLNFGLATVQLSLVALAVFLGNRFFNEHLDKNFFLTLLARPIKPSVFFLGRYLGVALLLALSSLTLSLFLIAFLFYLGAPITLTLLQACFGFFLESLFLLAVALLFSALNFFLVPLYVLAVFFIGHGLPPLLTWHADSSTAPAWSYFKVILPHLERVNWKSAATYGDALSGIEFTFSCLYLFCWILFCLCLSLFFFERKEFI